MNKVAIITLNSYFNYGNRLQNYALQESIKSLGFSVETIVNTNGKQEKRNILGRVDKLKNKSFKQIYNSLNYRFKNYMDTKLTNKDTLEKRKELFEKFTLDYIKEINYKIYGDDIIKEISDNYNYVITGSDQVWNPNYVGNKSTNFLTFVQQDKRIAYAPSFGLSEIKTEHIENYKQWLLGMHRLSVRENDGANIIKKLTGRDSPVLIDPTMLLTKEKWLDISKHADNKPQKKYLLTYFLNGISQKNKKQIHEIVKTNNLEIVNLANKNDRYAYETGPSEFIDYINSSSIFCTDSFHGCVFAILMQKPFVVYERQGTSLSMFSRINTLLDKFDLNARKAENIKRNMDVFNINYSHVPHILEAERKKAFSYLKEALNIKDEN